MKILQKPNSETQKSAMFFDGVIATSGDHSLETFQDGEIGYEGELFIGADTPNLAKEDVHDSDLEAEVIVNIYVDKFFTFKHKNVMVNDGWMFDDYDEAIEAFEKHISE